jgi:hypothetical protein
MLKYYQGIFFLTKNRLGTIRIAFQSHISIAIKYKELDQNTSRRIWENFTEPLDDSETKVKEELRANLDNMKTWSLNTKRHRHSSISCLGSKSSERSIEMRPCRECGIADLALPRLLRVKSKKKGTLERNWQKRAPEISTRRE